MSLIKNPSGYRNPSFDNQLQRRRERRPKADDQEPTNSMDHELQREPWGIRSARELRSCTENQWQARGQSQT